VEILVWLLVPLAVTVLGVVVLLWRNRDRKPADPVQGMEDMARFREAMERPLPQLHRAEPDLDYLDASDRRDTYPGETGRHS
jgi:hypothetical protein